MKRVHGAERISQSEIRKRATPMDRTLLEIDIVDAIASAPTAYTMGAVLPQFAPGGPGCPPHFPRWVPVMHQLLTGVLGSHSKASRVMQNERYWRAIRRHASKHGAPRARRQPPEHWHHTYSHRQLDAHIDALQSELRSDAIAVAREIGCMDPEAPFSHTNPLRGQFLSGDGKVVASPVRQRTVEKWKESGTGRAVYAHREWQNGEDQPDQTYGTKFSLLHTRPDNTRNNRVILDVERVPHGKGYRGEAGVSLGMIERLADTKDVRIDGVCYDGAFNGVHIDPLLKRGITVLSPMQKHKWTTPLELRPCKCGEVHDLVLAGGTVHERTILDTGEKYMTPCPRADVLRRPNADGMFRQYVVVAMSRCGTLHRIRVDTTPDDQARNFNRAHHLRLHIKTEAGTSLFDRCYGWREDAESANNTLDRTLYGGRMIAYTAIRQLTVMIGFAAGRNAIARWLHRRQQPGMQTRV